MDSENSDWRLTGQEKYLKDLILRLTEFQIREGKENWDHEHCEFCWQKIVPKENLDDYEIEVISAAYSSDDKCRWICPKCFEDFKEKFNWKLNEI